MSEPLRAPRGTRDLLPSDTPLWRKVEEAFREVFQRYGYAEIRTPLFEATELFTRGIGEGTDIVGKEMYSFLDRKGRSLTLRPEGTAGVVRAYAEHHLGAGERGEAKLFYIGPMFRYERPQAGRYRQFWQAGAEAIGFEGPLADAESVALLVEALRLCGIQDLSVEVNSVGCRACRPPYLEMLRDFLRAREAELSPESRLRIQTNPLRVLDSKDPRDAEAVKEAPKTTHHLCTACSAHFAAFLRALEDLGISHQVNKRLVRGLDYYTRTAFEVISSGLGAQNAVAGGGRYDRLVGEISGQDRPAVGFAAGLDRLVELLAAKPEGKVESACDAAVVFLGAALQRRALKLAQDLRRLGLRVWMDLGPARNLKSQLRSASQIGARFTLILGPDELARGRCVLKDMRSGRQEEWELAGVSGELLRRLKE